MRTPTTPRIGAAGGRGRTRTPDSRGYKAIRGQAIWWGHVSSCGCRGYDDFIECRGSNSENGFSSVRGVAAAQDAVSEYVSF